MSIEVTCTCGKKYHVKSEQIGKKAKCSCGRVFHLSPVAVSVVEPDSSGSMTVSNIAPPPNEPEKSADLRSAASAPSTLSRKPGRRILLGTIAAVIAISSGVGGYLIFHGRTKPTTGTEIETSSPPMTNQAVNTPVGHDKIKPPIGTAGGIASVAPTDRGANIWPCAIKSIHAPTESGRGMFRPFCIVRMECKEKLPPTNSLVLVYGINTNADLRDIHAKLAKDCPWEPTKLFDYGKNIVGPKREIAIWGMQGLGEKLPEEATIRASEGIGQSGPVEVRAQIWLFDGKQWKAVSEAKQASVNSN